MTWHTLQYVISVIPAATTQQEASQRPIQVTSSGVFLSTTI